jgi:hypothetical protein
VQALLRRLFAEVAAASDAEPRLLRAPAGTTLLQALLREQLWASGLLGACPEYDSAALQLAFSRDDTEKRRETLQNLMEGYARPSTQPRVRPARKGGRATLAEAGDDSMWGVRRHLESTDLRRWPPAVQALLRRLFAEVAAASDAEPRLRNAAAVRLARLQASEAETGRGAVSPAATRLRVLGAACHAAQAAPACPSLRLMHAHGCTALPCSRIVLSSCPILPAPFQDSAAADLEPLLEGAQMHACLLAAQDMPDKRATARLLASLMTKRGLAGLAGSAFTAIQASLPAAFLEELCGDLLSTAGLQTAAWQHIVDVLLERGTPGVSGATVLHTVPAAQPLVSCRAHGSSCAFAESCTASFADR